MYRILNAKNATLCFQRAGSAAQAIEFAKMYGHRGARFAELVGAQQ